jgi:DNA repair exonuclease SbcCD ATPase subunit
MVVSSLKSSELKECHDRIRQVVKSINDQRLELVTKSKITQADSLEISKWVTTLNSRLNKIALGQIDEIRTDLREPKQRIEKVTDKLQSAIHELEDFNKFLTILTGFVNLVGAILSPASGGLVKIAAVVNQLDNLT